MVHSITGKHIRGFKVDELLDLDERGLVTQISEPMSDTHKPHIEILNSMIKTMEAAGWKERKAIRCKMCRGFLNGRPKRFTESLTHKQLGKDCK
jgi:hypothetical protein